MDLGSILGSPLFNGDPDGYDIEDLYFHRAVKFCELAEEQACILHKMGKDPSTRKSGDMITFGQLQHHKIKPMYGISGSIDFQEARNAWNRLVLNSLRKLQKQEKDTYVSPFDGKLK